MVYGLRTFGDVKTLAVQSCPENRPDASKIVHYKAVLVRGQF